MKTPWIWHYDKAKSRCNNKNNNRYHRYGGRGIRFRITKSEIELIWYRDQASLLKKPSLDRRDNDQDYFFENCRFVEKIANVRAGRKVIRIDILGQERIFNSLIEAALSVNITNGKNICSCAQGKRPTAYGYVWRYYAPTKS